MNLNSGIKLNGFLEIWVRRKGKNWIKKVSKKNIVTNLGINLIRDNCFSSQSYYVSYGAVSDDSNAPTASDTSLGGNEIRVSFQGTNLTIDKKATVEYYIDGTMWGSITSISKAGLYYQSTGNYLFNASSFDSISVDSDTELLVRWTIEFSDV